MTSESDLQVQVADYLRCSVGGCNKPAKSRGYCAKHYTRFYRHGNALTNMRPGNKKHPLYSTWLAMKNRCNNPRGKDWPRYGGRGIRKKDNSFIARIKADGKEISKSFDSLSDAVEFRAKMEEKYARA